MMHLPTDLPPGPRVGAGGAGRNVAGLVTHASLGEHFYPLRSTPWNPWESTTFPLVEPSHVAPNGVRPAWVVAINAYSPIAHRSTLTRTVPPRSPKAAGVGRPTQRPRSYAPGFVTRWPQVAPRWPSFGEASGARRG